MGFKIAIMKKNFTLLLLLITTWIASFSNDGVFYSSGNTLIPLEETKIELKKEVLILTKRNSCNYQDGDLMDVIVYFEFYNPDTVTERLVGFVTPPASEKIGHKESEHPYVTNYCIEANEELLRFEIKRIDSTNFKVFGEEIYGSDFIYYTKVIFKKGKNVIKHSYTYKGSIYADMRTPGPNFNYRLTTGTTWANKQIDDFELFVNMGSNSYFSIPEGFEEDSNTKWQFIGLGQIGAMKTENGKKTQKINIKTNSGYLRYKKTDFKPIYDLTITTINPRYDINEYRDIFDPGIYNKPRNISDLSDNDLKIIRNSIFAFHGYKFNSKYLTDYFSQYTWYIPDPNINQVDIELESWEKELIEEILKEEKRRN